ncbi:Hypothetical protein PHPALM_36223 [Phytophthora palmivora]|uniref:Uncharacterized protein n=1 Tax=Phytophthora palmivora TaxID=4796 RepID=A0A2P4X0H9_9STRA|nr:Hypothetical protein PHPALM_36223 [Phytophthora palmivora]
MTQPSSEFSIASRWGDLARREVVNLQKSRQENARLKELVHYHQLQIKSIERVFKRRKRASEALMSYPLLLRCAGLSPRFHNRGVFDDLIAGMDEVYVNVDDFFTRVKMHELPCPGRRNDTIQCRERNIYLELLDCYAVPFDLQNAEKAVWTLKSTRAGESNVICSEVRLVQYKQLLAILKYFDAGENTRMKSICVAVLRHGIEMRVIVHAAVRKYTEEERTIFISRTLVEPIQDVFDVTFKETQRMVLKHGKSSATGPTTVIQTHSRVIDHEKMDQGKYQTRYASWKTSPYYDTGIQAWEHSLTHFNHRVEDMLLRESLHSSSIDMLPNKQLKH